MNKSPAFQFYAAEFLADENVVMMTNQEVGCYIKLMAYCWREGSIPSDILKIGKLCGEDGSAMAQLWLSIGCCFNSASTSDRLIHSRLETERQKQEKYRAERSESGKKGAKVKWNNGLPIDGSAIAQLIAQPMATDGSSSSSSTSSSTSSLTSLLNTKSKEKKEPKARYAIPDFVPQDAWDGFVQMRRTGKGVFTERAAALILKQLEAMRADGQDVAAVLDQSVANGWKGVFPLKQQNGAKNGKFNGSAENNRRLNELIAIELESAMAQGIVGSGVA